MKLVPKVSAAGLACAALLLAAAPAKALVIAPPPVSIRTAQADVVVVGKVVSIEEKTVSAPRFPNDTNKAEFQIAVVKIEDPILGAKKLTHVRVGFVPPPPPGGRPGPIRRIPQVNLVKDQEVCLFLKPHFDANFYTAQAYYDVIDKKSPNFEKEVAEAKRCAKLLAEPKAGLTAEKADERYLTAALLLTKYRTQPLGVPQTKVKEEAVDAEQSKLILKTLAEADWANNNNPQLARLNPQMLFNQLRLTDKDGWNPPMKEMNGRKIVDYAKLPEAAKQWCKENAGTYKVQRFVADKPAKDEKKD